MIPRANKADGTLSAGREAGIVAFGGGSGMSTILRGIKAWTRNIVAVVTVGDDGGSSGRLRHDLGIAPPGDLRNCLVALADESTMLPSVFQHRFGGRELGGHSLGNLLLAALVAECGGDLLRAMDEASRILRVRGRVLPSNMEKVALVAVHKDGVKTTGESRIGKSQQPIDHIELRPGPGRAPTEVLESIERADLLILGPGSLYTSVIPPLLAGGVQEAVRRSRAPRLYVANLMTQRGETTGYTVLDHVRAVDRHVFDGFVQAVLVNRRPIGRDAVRRYQEEGATAVFAREEARLARSGLRVFSGELAAPGTMVRHDAGETARLIFERVLPALANVSGAPLETKS